MPPCYLFSCHCFILHLQYTCMTLIGFRLNGFILNKIYFPRCHAQSVQYPGYPAYLCQIGWSAITRRSSGWRGHDWYIVQPWSSKEAWLYKAVPCSLKINHLHRVVFILWLYLLYSALGSRVKERLCFTTQSTPVRSMECLLSEWENIKLIITPGVSSGLDLLCAEFCSQTVKCLYEVFKLPYAPISHNSETINIKTT